MIIRYYKMTPEEKQELADNITDLETKIEFYLKMFKHSISITILLIIGGFVSLTLPYVVLPYTLFSLAVIMLYISYKVIYKWDWESDVLNGLQKSDDDFFNSFDDWRWEDDSDN